MNFVDFLVAVTKYTSKQYTFYVESRFKEKKYSFNLKNVEKNEFSV